MTTAFRLYSGASALLFPDVAFIGVVPGRHGLYDRGDNVFKLSIAILQNVEVSVNVL